MGKRKETKRFVEKDHAAYLAEHWGATCQHYSGVAPTTSAGHTALTLDKRSSKS